MKKYILSFLCLLVFCQQAYSQNITFADTLIEQSIKKQLNIPSAQPIHSSIADTVSTLDLSYLGLKEISDLYYFPRLVEINLSNNKLENVTVLKAFPYLKKVNLSNNRLQNIDALAEADAFKLLINVANNYIQDFSIVKTSDLVFVDLVGEILQKPVSELNAPVIYVQQLGHHIIDSTLNYVRVYYKAYTSTNAKGTLKIGDSTYQVTCDGWTYNMYQQFCQAGTYYSILNLEGQILRDTIIIPQAKKYKILPQINPIKFCRGDKVTITTDANRLGFQYKDKVQKFGYDTIQTNLAYRWYRNNIAIPNATNRNLITGDSGIYVVAVQNLANCIFYDTITLKQYKPKIIAATLKNISCKGQIDGTITIAISGGLAPYSIQWLHNANLTTATIRNLSKGDYSVAVRDAIGCVDTAKFIITEPDSIRISAQVTHNTRYGERNGKVNLIINGGTPNSLGNYSVVWKDSLGVTVATTEDLINLSSGLFIAYVKDSMNCEHKPFPVLIISPDSFYIKKADIKAISCSSAKNGSLNLLLHGGTPPYRMLSNKTGNDTIRLIGNTYSFSNLDLTTGERIEVVFIDKNNIAISRRFEMKEPTGIRKLTYSKTTYTFLDGIITPTLENVRFGSYSIVPNGAVMDSTGKVNLEQSIVNRTYTVRYITGVEVCDTTKFTFRLVATDSLLVVPIISLPDCKDSKNGSVRLNISTKSLPTKIRWSTGDTTAIISNLDYTTSPLIVNVFEANNKKVSLKINLPAPKGTPKISYSKNNYCNTETNPIATVSGMYNYSFASQPQGIVFLDSGTIDLQKSRTGNYNIQVLTPAGCIASTAINIFGLPTKQFYNKNIIACEKLTLDAANNNMPNVSYKWSNGETSQKITVTKSGTYIVTINSGLCQILDTIKVQISNLVVTTKATHLRGNGSIANGEIDVTSIVGNIGSATITWLDIPSVQRKRTGLKAGIYKFTVKDTLCSRDYQIEVKAPIVLQVKATKSDDTGCGGANGEIFLEIFGNGNETVTINGVVVKDARLGKLKAGLYKWTVKDTTEQELNGDVLLASADSLSAKIKTFDASCTNDGKVILDITGGRKPYLIEYTDVVTGTVKTANSNEISGLSVTSNEYIFVITDATGCKVQVRTRIRKSIISNLTIADSSTICEGNKAYFTVKYKGSLYPYSFSYSANREIFTISGVMDSVYKVEVTPKITTLYRLTDLRYGSNCLGTFAGQSFVTVNPLPILLNAQASDENCDNKDATILLSDKDVKAGKTPFLFAIQKVDSKDSLKFVKTMKFDSLAAGNYEVFVKDANTCVYKYPQVVVIKNIVCDLPNRLPNCITPNGDGINDTFEIRNAEFYPAMTMEIQDRFGRVIYKGSYKAWNPNDTNEAMGTYFYLINLGNGKIFKNFIDVVR